jgi:ubiquinone/menaquinone biosynthesis C-methylase UbiE
MNRPGTDTAFTGNIPEFYEIYLVPLIFAPYAENLATRAAGRQPSRVLEIAAGTGVVARCLATQLAPDISLIATDLNQAMLDHAAMVGTVRRIEWRQADAMALPFPDGTFDLVVCQFGAMFSPNREQAYAEARRLLRPGGAFIFNL